RGSFGGSGCASGGGGLGEATWAEVAGDNSRSRETAKALPKFVIPLFDEFIYDAPIDIHGGRYTSLACERAKKIFLGDATSEN
ncbi:MAG TPA: hypothetical protein VFV92_12755, partial [Candidatus Bathyarchaeia archaeon]|nr:hypothetical protein [Candidatus Bathyarchaeia archaeon]